MIMKTHAKQPNNSNSGKVPGRNQASARSIIQAYKDKTTQLQTAKEEELLQGKFETIQKMGVEEEEPVQGKFEATQLATEEEEPLQRQPNNTGLPDNLKSGIENMSGYSMDDVKVHYNSSQPATLQAHAYAQGTDIHVAPGQEKHVPHEAWHVVQQKQGRVKPTMQMKGTVPVNDDAGLEKEADVMGAKALSHKSSSVSQLKSTNGLIDSLNPCIQQASSVKTTTANYDYDNNTKKETVGRSMIAELDPGSPINGSAPGDGEQVGLMSYLKDTKDFKSMKRGHLMNGQLGGPGIAQNMFPITSKANTHHQLHVENYIKQAISNGVGILYTVTVNSNYDADSSDSAAAEFICDSWVLDSPGVIDLTEPEPFTTIRISSKPEAGSSGGGGIVDETISAKLRFLTKDLPHGWGEKGKGLQEWDDSLPGHFSTKKGGF